MSENPVAVTQALLPVIQADREAAADYAREHGLWPTPHVEGIRIGSEAWDAYHLTQAFARHRLAGLDREADGAAGGEDCPFIAGNSWKEPEDDCWTSEVQIVGGHYVVATVHGATQAEAEARRDAVVAALTKPTPPASVSGDVVVVPRAWAEFVYGISPWEGDDSVWFGDAHPTMRGKFWWRKQLGEALAAAPEAATSSALRAALESEYKPKLGEGDYAYLKREHLPMALREQAKDALFFDAEPHVVIDAWNIIQIAADELATPSAVGGVDRMREALQACVFYIASPLRMSTDDAEDARRARLLEKARAALATGETSPDRENSNG